MEDLSLTRLLRRIRRKDSQLNASNISSSSTTVARERAFSLPFRTVRNFLMPIIIAVGCEVDFPPSSNAPKLEPRIGPSDVQSRNCEQSGGHLVPDEDDPNNDPNSPVEFECRRSPGNAEGHQPGDDPVEVFVPEPIADVDAGTGEDAAAAADDGALPDAGDADIVPQPNPEVACANGEVLVHFAVPPSDGDEFSPGPDDAVLFEMRGNGVDSPRPGDDRSFSISPDQQRVVRLCCDALTWVSSGRMEGQRRIVADVTDMDDTIAVFNIWEGGPELRFPSEPAGHPSRRVNNDTCRINEEVDEEEERNFVLEIRCN